jgi:signal peptidase I
METNTAKKFKTGGVVLFTAVILFSLYVIGSIMLARARGETPGVFGYSFHVVLTDSMSPELEPGDFFIAKKAGNGEITKDDWIVYTAPSGEAQGKLIVHSVYEIYGSGDGAYFRTKGLNSPAPDSYDVHKIAGKFVSKSALLGAVFGFLSEIQNILFLALIVAALTLAYKQVRNILRVKKEAADGNAEPAAVTQTCSSGEAELLQTPPGENQQAETAEEREKRLRAEILAEILSDGAPQPPQPAKTKPQSQANKNAKTSTKPSTKKAQQADGENEKKD